MESDEFYTLGDKFHDIVPISQLELEEILERYHQSAETPEDGENLVLYILQEMHSKGLKEISAMEVQTRTGELIAGHMLRKLSEHDLIDVLIDENGEPHTSWKEEN